MSSAQARKPPLQALLDAFNAHDVDAIMSSPTRMSGGRPKNRVYQSMLATGFRRRRHRDRRVLPRRRPYLVERDLKVAHYEVVDY